MAYVDIAWLPATENEFELHAAPCALLYVTTEGISCIFYRGYLKYFWS